MGNVRPQSRALLVASEAGVNMEVQFNPKELSVDKSVSWTNAQGPATEDPVQEFKEPQSRTLSCTLYFDTFEDNADVRKYTAQLEKLVTIVEGKGRPPVAIFQWADFNFKGVVESLQQKFTMFHTTGIPCRCEVTLKMKSATNAVVGTKPQQ